MQTKFMNHEEYPLSLRVKSDDEIRHTAKDAAEAANANPNGENVSYYLDEICYCCDELHRRKVEHSRRMALGLGHHLAKPK